MNLFCFYCDRKHFAFYLFSLLLLFCTCSTDRQDRKQSKGGNPIVVKEVELERRLLSVSAIMADYIYIPLETDEKSVISSIGEVMYSDSVFFFQQYAGNPALAFDSRGNFITAFGQRGRGPGEYLSYSAIDHRPHSDLFYILDNTQRKIIGYDRTGKSLLEIRLLNLPGANLNSFRSIDDHNFLVEVTPYPPSSVKPYVSLIDKNGEEIDRFEFESAVFTVGSLRKSGLVRYGQSIYFMPEYSDIVYRYFEGRMIPVFDIDPRADHDLLLLEQAHIQRSKATSATDYMRADNLYRGMWGVTEFIETEKFINFKYYYDATKLQSVHYDKITGELSASRIDDDIVDGVYKTSFVGASANFLFKTLHLSQYTNLDSLKNRIHTKNANMMDAKMRNTIDSLTNYSNPVLVCYKLK